MEYLAILPPETKLEFEPKPISCGSLRRLMNNNWFDYDLIEFFNSYHVKLLDARNIKIVDILRYPQYTQIPNITIQSVSTVTLLPLLIRGNSWALVSLDPSKNDANYVVAKVKDITKYKYFESVKSKLCMCFFFSSYFSRNILTLI